MEGHAPQPPAPDDPGAAGGKPGRAAKGRKAAKKPKAVRWFGDMPQLDFEIDFFERLLARKQRAVDVLRVLAELVSRKGLHDRAVDLDRRLVEILPEDFLARYNLACSLARVGSLDEAIEALSRAILLGYDDLAHMESDPDLASLRGHPDFEALLASE